jgi:hypothetical protein
MGEDVEAVKHELIEMEERGEDAQSIALERFFIHKKKKKIVGRQSEYEHQSRATSINSANIPYKAYYKSAVYLTCVRESARY